VKVQEVMERAGTKQAAKTIAYCKDALDEIQMSFPDKSERYKISIVSGVRWYSFPSDLIRLRGVFRKYDENDRFIKISRLVNVNIIEDESSATSVATTTDDDVGIF